MPTQEPLPQEYHKLTGEALAERIAARKAELGSSLCILGHHYQSDGVIQFADFTGDSLKLSQQAAAQDRAKYIVFCGVHFMAESAAILSRPGQVVCLPNLQAGCAMADMADDKAVGAALDELTGMTGARIVPVTYVNSTAATKAVTGRAGGACCTSSNARNVFEWALRSADKGGAGGEKIFAIPDQHLGRNTAVAMGFGLDDCVVYDPHLPNGGIDGEQLEKAKFILWKGHCYVHQIFTADNVRRLRSGSPRAKIIVHPECPYEVVRLADAAGSTEQIIRAVASADPPSRWAIGTEEHLVGRLARLHGDKSIRLLSDAPAVCAQMQQIDLPHLLWVLDNIAAGRAVNRITVAPEIAADARAALQRMIDIKASPDVTPTGG